MSASFYGGVHPDDHKAASCGEAIQPLGKPPSQVVLSMSMHIGAPCKPVVKKGDSVTVGQTVGEAQGLGAPIHASVSGTVTAVEPRPYVGGGKVMSVVIENDLQNTFQSQLIPKPDYRHCSPDELVAVIRDAGITGMGGAGFPTHVKISSGLGKVDTILINAAECEPYITADHRLMLEQGEKIISGVQILMYIFGLDTATIGIEDNKADAIAHMTQLAADTGIDVKAMHTRYPQGAEKQLIQCLTGREVPPGGLPAHVGCAVFNAGTAAAVYDAVVSGLPLTSRIVTVTGGAITSPRNLIVPLGTSFQHLIDEAGGFKEEPERVLCGGPMMGLPQYDLSVSTLKGTNAVLCLTRSEVPETVEHPTCIRCARCVNVCPMHLLPVYMHLYGEKRRWQEVEQLNVMDCIECGSCSYICPARIPLVQSFRTAKFEIRSLAAKAKAAAQKEATV